MKTTHIYAFWAHCIPSMGNLPTKPPLVTCPNYEDHICIWTALHTNYGLLTHNTPLHTHVPTMKIHFEHIELWVTYPQYPLCIFMYKLWTPLHTNTTKSYENWLTSPLCLSITLNSVYQFFLFMRIFFDSLIQYSNFGRAAKKQIFSHLSPEDPKDKKQDGDRKKKLFNLGESFSSYYSSVANNITGKLQ